MTSAACGQKQTEVEVSVRLSKQAVTHPNTQPLLAAVTAGCLNKLKFINQQISHDVTSRMLVISLLNIFPFCSRNVCVWLSQSIGAVWEQATLTFRSYPAAHNRSVTHRKDMYLWMLCVHHLHFHNNYLTLFV